MRATTLPVVQSTTGTTHAVWATGSSLDGGIVGFYTLCGHEVKTWSEVEERVVTCGTCERLLETMKHEEA